MEYMQTHRVLTEQVLNKNTGELETKDFKEIISKKRLRGGFSMIYNSYNQLELNVIKSNLDVKLLLLIRTSFTYKQTEIKISPTDVSKTLDTSHQKVSTFIKMLVEEKFLIRIARGMYRMNPFMFVPYKADGSELQAEWNEIIGHQGSTDV